MFNKHVFTHTSDWKKFFPAYKLSWLETKAFGILPQCCTEVLIFALLNKECNNQ